jgi:hypothetical protein
MIRIILTVLTLATLSAAAGFDEEGSSRSSCDGARKEALFLAKANCLSLGAQDSQKENFSRCKNQDGKHFVTVSYNCELSQEDESEGYDPDYSEESSTNL